MSATAATVTTATIVATADEEKKVPPTKKKNIFACYKFHEVGGSGQKGNGHGWVEFLYNVNDPVSMERITTREIVWLTEYFETTLIKEKGGVKWNVSFLSLQIID